jgi:hypothetical protein
MYKEANIKTEILAKFPSIKTNLQVHNTICVCVCVWAVIFEPTDFHEISCKPVIMGHFSITCFNVLHSIITWQMCELLMW